MVVEATTKSNIVNNFDDDDEDGPVFFKRNNAASRQNQVNPDVRKPSSSTFNGQNSNAQKGKTPVPSSKPLPVKSPPVSLKPSTSSAKVSLVRSPLKSPVAYSKASSPLDDRLRRSPRLNASIAIKEEDSLIKGSNGLIDDDDEDSEDDKPLSSSLKGNTNNANKNTNNITENEGNGKPKAIWSDDLVAILCEICVKEMAKGNRPPGTHFDKIEWVNVVNVFKEITGRDYDQLQLQRKWVRLKTHWKLWSSQLHKETGIGWDPAKKMVDAPPKWWQRKIEMHVEYLKKGKKGKLGGLEHDKQTVDRENVEASQDDQDRGKKRTNDENEINKGVVGGLKGKKAKLGGAVKLSKQIDRLVEVVGSTSKTTPVYIRSQGTSIPEVMEVVATLPGAERGSQLWWFATELFCSQDKREMFSVMTDLDLKLQFLIRNQKKSGN